MPRYREGSRLWPISARRIVPNGARTFNATPVPVSDCQLRSRGAIPSRRLLEEQIDPVLLEDVERIRATDHRQIVEPHARRGHAVNARVVEQPELVPAEPIEVLPTEVAAVEVHFLEEPEEEVARQVRRCTGGRSAAALRGRRPALTDRGVPTASSSTASYHAPLATKLYPPRRYSYAPPTPFVVVLLGTTKRVAVVVSL